MDASSVLLIALGVISLGFAFLHYKITRNNKLIKSKTE